MSTPTSQSFDLDETGDVDHAEDVEDEEDVDHAEDGDDTEYGDDTEDDDDLGMAWYEPVQTETPPPTPVKKVVARAPPPRNTEGYWGYLEPVNPSCPYKDWYFARKQDIYTLGASDNADFQVTRTSIVDDYHCSIMWDGTDTAYAVHVVDYADQDWGPWGGTFINESRLLPNIRSLLRHGDRIFFTGEDPLGENEDLRFIWRQCTSKGWRSAPHIQPTSKLRNEIE